jgi:hypothetical protein
VADPVSLFPAWAVHYSLLFYLLYLYLLMYVAVVEGFRLLAFLFSWFLRWATVYHSFFAVDLVFSESR